jgi:hypothetical protein
LQLQTKLSDSCIANLSTLYRRADSNEEYTKKGPGVCLKLKPQVTIRATPNSAPPSVQLAGPAHERQHKTPAKPERRPTPAMGRGGGMLSAVNGGRAAAPRWQQRPPAAHARRTITLAPRRRPGEPRGRGPPRLR